MAILNFFTLKRTTIILLGFLLIIIGSWGIDLVVVQNMAMNDVMPRYVGCQGFFRGDSPYSQKVDAEIDAFVRIGEKWGFSYPPHLCFVLLPIWLLPYEASVSLWMLLNLLFFLAFPVLYGLVVLRWRLLPLQLLALTFSIVLGFRYTMMTITLGQFTGFVLLCMVGAIWGLRNQRVWLTAFCLAGMTIRPDGGLIALGLCGIAFLIGQRRVIPIWVGLMAIIWLGTHVFIGNWELQFVNHLRDYADINRKTSWLPLDLGPAGAIVLTVGFLGWTAWIFIRIWKLLPDEPQEFVLWASAMIILPILVLFPQTNPYTLVYALPVFMLLAYVLRRSVFQASVWLLIASSWVFFLMGWWRVDQIFYPVVLALGVAWWLYTKQRRGRNLSVSPASVLSKTLDEKALSG